jgi:hypothetical protein
MARNQHTEVTKSQKTDKLIFITLASFDVVLFVGLLVGLIDWGLLWLAGKNFRRGELMAKF